MLRELTLRGFENRHSSPLHHFSLKNRRETIRGPMRDSEKWFQIDSTNERVRRRWRLVLDPIRNHGQGLQAAYHQAPRKIPLE
jgi:hypothetical protein